MYSKSRTVITSNIMADAGYYDDYDDLTEMETTDKGFEDESWGIEASRTVGKSWLA